MVSLYFSIPGFINSFALMQPLPFASYPPGAPALSQSAIIFLYAIIEIIKVYIFGCLVWLPRVRKPISPTLVSPTIDC